MVIICGPVCHISSRGVGGGWWGGVQPSIIMGPVGLCSPPAFLSVSSATMTISVHTAALFRQDGLLPRDLWLSSDHLHSDFGLGCVRLCVHVCALAHPQRARTVFVILLFFVALGCCKLPHSLWPPGPCKTPVSHFILSPNFVTICVTQRRTACAGSLPALCCCLVARSQPNVAAAGRTFRFPAFRASHFNGGWFQDTRQSLNTFFFFSLGFSV